MNPWLIVHLVFGVFAVVGVFLAMSTSKNWIIRGQMNFRWYYGLFITLLLAALPLVWSSTLLFHIYFLLLGMAWLVCLWTILPFTILHAKEIAKSKTAQSGLSMMVFNVLQDNESYDAFSSLARDISPDLVLMMETDQKWYDGVTALRDDYPYEIHELRDDTYGILLISRIPLDRAEVRHLVKKEIPSLEICLTHNSHKYMIMCVHPEPPLPGEALTSRPKDLEILRAANVLVDQDESYAKLLIGDLNDVAWSQTSQTFKELTGLGDPRVGRGMYNTFPTHKWIRFPLDHVFCSKYLKIKRFQRLPDVGSDHFPMLIEVSAE